MSERDELRRRCDEAVWAELWPESQLDHASSDGAEIRLCVDAVLAEIERTDVLVPRERAEYLEAVEAAARGMFEDGIVDGDGEELWVNRASGERLISLLGVDG